MKTHRPLWTLLVAVLLGGAACSATGHGTVAVLASWTGAEEGDFKQVLDAFKAKTGITVDYRGTRALDQVLASDVQRGTPPDVAVLPNPGALVSYVHQGKVKALGDVLGAQSGSYGPQWQSLDRVGSQQYAVAVKADLKSSIWYATANLPGPKPATWAELLALSGKLTAGGRTPWCLGLGAPPTSGWPGTDWIEDILLHTAGAAFYQRWAAGEVPWTAPEIRKAWTDWGDLVTGAGAVRGGAAAALLTDFGDAGRPLFAGPPGCLLEHQASFVMGGYLNMKRADGTTPKPGTDFDFFRFPGPEVSEVSADLAGMFTDTPQARELMRFLASDEAQRIWPGIHRGSVFSVNKTVTGVYDDPVSQRVAQTLTVSTQPLCFDASDLMPATMTGAFYRAVLEYLNNPGRLDELLRQLETVSRSVPAGDWLDVPCGQ